MSAIIPCIFGTTKGFEIIELAPLPFKMKDLLVAITHGEVELSLEDSCIKLLRIKAGNDVYTWIGLYRKAYEMGFSREGGYYGAGVWLSDTTVNARHVLDALEDMSQQIRRLALEDRKFQKPLADIVQKLVPSQAVSALLSSKAPYVKGGINAEARNCAFIAQPQAARDIVTWAQNDALAHNFQSVIIAPASAFPKAGASGNITQYADVASLERALERDYVARLAKLDAQNKDLQRRAQSLEAESGQRSSEIQALKQRNSQLETEVTRSRLLVRPDGKTHAADDDSFLSRDNAIPLVLCAGLAILSIMGNFALGVLYSRALDQASYDSGQKEDIATKLEEKTKLLTAAEDKLKDTEARLKEFAEDQTNGDKAQSQDNGTRLTEYSNPAEAGSTESQQENANRSGSGDNASPEEPIPLDPSLRQYMSQPNENMDGVDSLADNGQLDSVNRAILAKQDMLELLKIIGNSRDAVYGDFAAIREKYRLSKDDLNIAIAQLKEDNYIKIKVKKQNEIRYPTYRITQDGLRYLKQ